MKKWEKRRLKKLTPQLLKRVSEKSNLFKFSEFNPPPLLKGLTLEMYDKHPYIENRKNTKITSKINVIDFSFVSNLTSFNVLL